MTDDDPGSLGAFRQDEEGEGLTWRDPTGVVHVVAGPVEVPDLLRHMIETYLAVEDWDDAMSRSAALGSLVGNWEEEAIEQFAASDEIEEGPACEPGGQELEPVVDQAVERELRTAQHDAPLIDRLDLLAAIRRLIGEWEDYSLDYEKLLGHLIAVHGESEQLRHVDHEQLLGLHAQKHHGQ
ncbi:MAG TPA: hypothetical protein VK988_10255 [Acidimicrobiales bacterium]|nr:hypothetical protein [Acidimicrobiales bacterium]